MRTTEQHKPHGCEQGGRARQTEEQGRSALCPAYVPRAGCRAGLAVVVLALSAVSGRAVAAQGAAAGQEAEPRRSPNEGGEPELPAEREAPASEPAPAEARAVVPPRLAEAPLLRLASIEPGQTVSIILEITVDEQGAVRDPAVVDPAAREPLRDLALRLMRQHRFVPARRGQEPVAVRVAYRLDLRGAPATAPLATLPASREDNMHGGAAASAPLAPSPTGSRSAAALDDNLTFEATAAVARPLQAPTRHVLRRSEVTRVPGTSGDPLLAIEVLPSVSRSGGGEPIVRGAAPHQSVTLLDGTPVPFLYHFGGLRSFVHPELIEQVELYPGNFSTRYGRASSGVVEARLRDPRTDRFGGQAHLSVLDTSVLIEGPVSEHWSMATAARRSNIDAAFDAFVPEGTFSAIAAPVYYDYQSLWRYAPSVRESLRLAAFGSSDSLELVFDNPSEGDPTLRGQFGGVVEFHRVQLLYEHVGQALRQSLQASVGSQRVRQSGGPNASARFDAVDLDARGQWDYAASGAWNFSVGFDLTGQSLVGAYRGSPAPAAEGSLSGPNNVADELLIDRVRVNSLRPAAYAEAHLGQPDRLQVTAGVRADYYSRLRVATLDPRLAGRWAPRGGPLTLKAALGLFSQPPLYYETLEVIGNPSLQPYWAAQSSLGFELTLGTLGELTMDTFYKRLERRVVATAGQAAPFFVNDGTARIYGGSVGLALRPGKGTTLSAAYTLSRSERSDRGEAYRLFDFDQTHVANVAARMPLGWGLELGARFRFVTGNPLTPVDGAIYEAGADLYYPQFGPQNSTRDPNFHQLDLRLDKAWPMRWGRLRVFVDIQNAYGADNPQGYNYSYDYSRRERTSGIPFFPNIGVGGEI